MTRLGVLALLLFACGGDDKTKQDAHVSDAPKDGAIDAPHDAAAPDAPLDGPPGTQLLTVKNYLNWCKVSVDGGTASTLAQQQVFVQPGPITLTATPVTGFELDAHMWHHTDGDGGTGEAGAQTGSATTGTSTATATVASTSGKCVWVCCPFTNGTGCTNITPDPCQ